MTPDDNEDSFFLDLEKAAKSLSIGNDAASTVALRRLFQELRREPAQPVAAVLPEDEAMAV